MKNYYSELGLKDNATKEEIKSAYRLLAKKYHPDTGGNHERFLAIQNAWETLNDHEKKADFDRKLSFIKTQIDNSSNLSIKVKQANNSASKDYDIKFWFKNVYQPINRVLNQVIKPLNNEIKNLSADPYDEKLMESFCKYIEDSRKKIDKSSSLFKSNAVPSSISNLGVDLYHCFSQVQDALDELDRYTEGYVDDYLFDGKQMMKEAKIIQRKMISNKKNISF
tara:strand:- start:16493 stop:17161 length:669 start_codon:yes stop_codon:yes gene_type:complete